MKYHIKETRLNFIEDKPTVWKVQRLTMATVSEKELIKYIANSAQVPASTITACILAISEAITYFVINGHYVTFDSFGSFYLKIDTKVARTKKECTLKQVRHTTIGFTASPTLSDLINQASMEKVDSLSVKSN